jgi:hypothetical protein
MSHPTIQAPFNDLVASLVTAGTSLVQAAVALFHLVLAFGYFWLDKFVQFAQTCIQLGFELFKGVAGFVVGMSGRSGLKGTCPRSALIQSFLAANFFVLLVFGGGYYWWHTRSQNQSYKGRRAIKSRN